LIAEGQDKLAKVVYLISLGPIHFRLKFCYL